MLFLVKGALRHEALWHRWFERAEGLLPQAAVSAALCGGGGEAAKRATETCSQGWLAAGGAAVGGSPVGRQQLFDVYVHPHPNFTGAMGPGRRLPGIR